MKQQGSTSSYYQQRLHEAVYTLQRVTPEHYALFLASVITNHSFDKALQQLQQLQSIFTNFTIATRGFTLDTSWQHHEAKAESQTPPLAGGEDEYLTPEEVAAYLRISQAKVYRYIHGAQLQYVNHGTKQKPRYRVLKSIVTAFRPSP